MFNTETVAITDYRLMTPSLAKVIVSFTGNIDRRFLHEKLTEMFDGCAQPVRASFKQIQEGVAVGFIKANRAIRMVDEKQLKAYRLMGSNIMMDESDKSLWEVKTGASGKYLARHGQEDLQALVQASKITRTDIPRIAHLTIARATAAELMSFVDDEGDVDHGFAYQTSESQVRVVSFARKMPMTVDYDAVVGIVPMDVPAHVRAQVIASMTPEEKKQANAYWTRLYSYAPDYMRETIKQVNEGTFA